MRKNPVNFRFLTLSIFILISLYGARVSAQIPGNIGVASATGLFDSLIDRMGNKYPLVNLAINDTLRANGDSIIINQVAICSSGYFQIYMEPGCGLDDSTNSADVARKNVLCQVLHDISQFIHSPLTSSGNKINIWVRNRANVPGGTSAIGYATSFYNVPLSSATTGIADNISWITLHLGRDGYAGLDNPTQFPASTPGTFFHVVASFDFDDYTFHTDLTTVPLSSEYDLYTVMLREMTHALGFVSEINSDGTSLLGANYPYYSRYDKFLQTHSGVPLITNTGSYSMYSYTFNPALSSPGNILAPNTSYCVTDSTNCDTAVQYVGSVTEPVYTPNCYETGFSLTSFEDECTGTPSPSNNNVYFTASNVTNIGSMKRYLKPEERLALADIGYTVDTIYGDSTHLNYHDYGGNIDTGICVAGGNDGLDSDGSYFYFSSSLGSIQINGAGLNAGTPGILDNDVNADSFEGLTVVSGTGTVNVTGGTSSTVVTYTVGSGDFGSVLLRYVPVNTLTGKRGSTAYVSLEATYSVSCPSSPCQLVENGTFAGAICGVLHVDTHAYLCNWWSLSADIDVNSPDCTFDSYGNPSYVSSIPFGDDGCGPRICLPAGVTGCFVGISGSGVSHIDGSLAFGTIGWASEKLETQLTAPLIPGGVYQLSCWARVGVNPGEFTDAYNTYHSSCLQFFVSTNIGSYSASGGYLTIPTTTSTLTLLDRTTATTGFLINATLPCGSPDSTLWQHVTRTFTFSPTAPFPTTTPSTPQYLQVWNAPYLTTSRDGLPVSTSGYPTTNFRDLIFVSDVSIVPVMSVKSQTVCPGETSLIPNHLVVASGYLLPSDTYVWSPSGDVSCSTCNNPFFIISPSATTTYTLTVTDGMYECTDTLDVTANPLPLPGTISGTTTVCLGSSITLTDAGHTGTGTWSSGNTGIATVNSSGVVHSLGTGTVVITYSVTNSNGCTASTSFTVTVEPLPSAGVISGTYTVCPGSATTLSVTGSSGTGTWSSSNLAVATVNSSGSVKGLMQGVTAITYSVVNAFGCTASTYSLVTVEPLPSAGIISGTYTICSGSVTTLSVTGSIGVGSWSSSNTADATVNSSGVVTGISPGSARITYTATNSCGTAFTYSLVTVKSSPTALITASVYTVCAGSAITLSSSGTGGGTWISGNMAIATVTEGASTTSVYGVSSGTVAITYSVTNSSGCSASTYSVVTVKPAPFAGILSGTFAVCVGSATALILTGDSTGGTWSSSNSGEATVSSSGMVTGISSGSVRITYTIAGSDGCTVSTYSTVAVNGLPTLHAITGTYTVCVGGTATVSVSSAAGAGTWTSSNTAVATVTSSPTYSAIWGGISPGTATITFTSPPNSSGCVRVTYSVVTVNPGPNPGGITGTYTLCVGGTTTLNDTGYSVIGTWSSGNTSIATVNSSGMVYGIGSGTVVITYSVTNSCGSVTTSSVVTVEALPVVAAITGTTTVCSGATVSLGDATSGGTWSSSNNGIATVNSLSGLTGGLSAGTDTIRYTVTNGFGCTASVSKLITVDTLPLIALITGDTTGLCPGDTIILSDVTSGGVWHSSDTTIATVDSTGTVTGILSGTVTIGYTYTNGAGCSVTTTKIITIFSNYISPIIGATSMCQGLNYLMTDSTAPGTWRVLNPHIEVILDSGLVKTILPGIDTIIYISTNADGCRGIVFHIDTVHPYPVVAQITAPDSICLGSNATVFDSTTGGTWSSETGAISVDGSGIIYGNLVGTDTITYTVITSFGCSNSVTVPITVDSLPYLGGWIGPDSLCVGDVISLSDSITGGVWVIGDSTVATVDSFGNVTGIGPGSTSIDYIITNSQGCSNIYDSSITVDTLPAVTAIFGRDSVCLGSSVMVYDSTAGGYWRTAPPSVATIDSTGLVTGFHVGVVNIFYIDTNSYGCESAAIERFYVIKLPNPGHITGEDSICVGGTTVLSDFVSGGTWSSSDITIATVDSSGTVTGIAIGAAVISYGVSNGLCSDTTTDSIYVLPPLSIPAITGTDTICSGSTTTLEDADSGGTWISYNTSIATVDPVSGIVGGITGGTAIIAYTITSACGTAIALDTIIVIPAVPPINGLTAVCSGFTSTLSNIVSGGTWSSSNTSIASVNSSGVVTGIASGVVTITYAVAGTCGSFTATTTFGVNTPPYITTNFKVACQALDDEGGGLYVISDTSGCIDVCDSTVVRYYANGVDSSAFTWAVTGGTVVNNYIDSIDVFWPTAGTTGSITLNDTFNHCTGIAVSCIRVIQKPRAYFISSSVNVCLGSPVVFIDLSTADSLSPIVSYYWNFGDGTGSDLANPAPHTFTTGGVTDTVMLVVKNGCNCSDTFRAVLNISNTSGPLISCASMVCDSQNATYSIPNDSCMTGYGWGVVGGTILSGDGTTSITVDWNMVDSSGYGYVGVVDPCSACPDTSVIKIPVILANAAIEGPDVICANEQYTYMLPLWPATQYMWGILGHPEDIVEYNNDYKVTVTFPTAGTYTVHAWYQNTLELCGGNVFKTITVKNPVSILGNTTLCQNEDASYTLSDSTLEASWTLINDTTGASVYSSSGTDFDYTFSTPGTYLLSATGDFCADPITITVLPLPPAIDSVNGQDTVCMGRVYSYTAHSDVPGTIYSWQAIGGTVSPISGSSVVSVVWTAGGAMQLLVHRVSASPPYCQGPTDTIHIQQEIIAPNVIGDSAPCANAYRTYHTTYTHGEAYGWSVTPNTAGSVVSGDHTTAITVLWNNVSTITSASIVLTVHKCDSIVSDTLHVTLHPDGPVTVTASPNPVCPGAAVAFTASPGDSAYVWNFGDGTADVITTVNTISHAFPLNTTTGNIYYTIQVTGLPGVSYGCPSSGTASYILAVLPGPVAYASTAGPQKGCPPLGYTLVGTVTDNVSGLTYQWYEGGTPSLGTASTQSISDISSYYFIVTASNGCTATSNTLTFIADCPGGPGSGSGGSGSSTTGGAGSGCGADPTLSATHTCNTITLHASGSGPSLWLADAPPVGGLTSPTSTITSATYNLPGIYRFEYATTVSGSPLPCPDTVNIADTIDMIPDFRYGLSCAAGSSDSVFLIDYTVFLPGCSLTGFTWTEATLGALGSGPSLHVSLPAPGTYIITEVVNWTSPSGSSFTCLVTHTITLPGLPHASFTYSASPICSTVPIYFTATSTAGISQYDWNFGDLSSSLLENPQRAYLWSPPASNPELFTVTLTVTDSIGCSGDTTAVVRIQENLLNGTLGPNLTVCSGDAPVTLTFNNTSSYADSTYLWSTGATTSSISVDTSGAYWVTVTGEYECQARFPVSSDLEVNIIKVPSAVINGRLSYCIGDVVELSGYAGAGVLYKWLKNGVAHGTTSSIADPAPVAGTYTYQLILGVTDSATLDTCYDSSAIVTVVIHPLPPAPTIIGPVALDCNTYHLELTATEPSSGTYNWSDGTVGAVDNSIYSGGPYEVWFTDIYGCVSNSSTAVPNSPGYYFQYFPTGCYTVCAQQLPLVMYGPPDYSFSSWAWLLNGDTALSGTSIMSQYSIDTSGDYQWELNNGLCSQESGNMGVTVFNCNTCSQAKLEATLVCDTGNPSSYTATVILYSPEAGTTYVLGTNMGPLVPFSGTLPSVGTYVLNLTFTTFTAPPDSVEIEVLYTLPDGEKCFQKKVVFEPLCTWEEERNASNDSAGNGGIKQPVNFTNAMLVFPNPTSGAMTISYDYGTDEYADRSLTIYDGMGRKAQSIAPTDVRGNWNLNTSDWTPGIYIIRMEGGGKTLQTQRVIVTH